MLRPLFPALALLLLACGTTTTTGSGGGSSTASATTGAGGASTSSSTSTGSSASTGGIACPPDCPPGLTCCSGQCVNTANDIFNCAGCGKVCMGDHPFCAGATCADPPCNNVGTCKGFCCDTECCDNGMLCCGVPGPGATGGPKCVAPENGTCPKGCPTCN